MHEWGPLSQHAASTAAVRALNSSGEQVRLVRISSSSCTCRRPAVQYPHVLSHCPACRQWFPLQNSSEQSKMPASTVAHSSALPLSVHVSSADATWISATPSSVSTQPVRSSADIDSRTSGAVIVSRHRSLKFPISVISFRLKNSVIVRGHVACKSISFAAHMGKHSCGGEPPHSAFPALDEAQHAASVAVNSVVRKSTCCENTCRKRDRAATTPLTKFMSYLLRRSWPRKLQAGSPWPSPSMHRKSPVLFPRWDLMRPQSHTAVHQPTN